MAEPVVAKDARTRAPNQALSGALKVGIALAVVVAAQCVLAWMLLPFAASIEAPEPRHDTKSHAAGPLEQQIVESQERREVDLGQFSVTTIDPTSNRTFLIEFHLYAAVMVDLRDHLTAMDEEGGDHGKGSERAEAEDTSRFGRLLKQHKLRFRDQVIDVVQSASFSDLTDPALALIKSQILAKTNALLGEPLVKEVTLSEFAAVQQ
jgi:flagellar basal body-associated protein FliL